jgi:DNA-binding NarL/FixJ family response regulator
MKALLIDDHPLILSALSAVIQGLDEEVDLSSVLSAQQARAALAADSTFDLVLLDLHLDDADGFDLLIELRATHPSLPVVVVSASDRSADIFRAIELGAMGFVPKRASNQLLLSALSMVMSGGIYVPPVAMRSQSTIKPPPMSHHDVGARPSDASAVGDGVTVTSLASFGLTRRQTDVLALLLRGQSNKLIARELSLSVETIKDHIAAVLRTLKVNSRTQAVLAVSQMAHREVSSGWTTGHRGARSV